MESRVFAQDELMIVKSVQDVEPILNACKERVETGNVGGTDMKHAASFPMVLVEAYMNRLGITFQEFLQNKEHIKTMLNDRSLEGFRIWKGAV